jgi:hypothetical protein
MGKDKVYLICHAKSPLWPFRAFANRVSRVIGSDKGHIVSVGAYYAALFTVSRILHASSVLRTDVPRCVPPVTMPPNQQVGPLRLGRALSHQRGAADGGKSHRTSSGPANQPQRWKCGMREESRLYLEAICSSYDSSASCACEWW